MFVLREIKETPSKERRPGFKSQALHVLYIGRNSSSSLGLSSSIPIVRRLDWVVSEAFPTLTFCDMYAHMSPREPSDTPRFLLAALSHRDTPRETKLVVRMAHRRMRRPRMGEVWGKQALWVEVEIRAVCLEYNLATCIKM